ncbi:PfkB family carbohydrate kinase [Thermoleophilum album]|uniref:Sugar or nucleoside kinase, ribokinase family n=1 Tax=Thermoleophilum album TaxID=29539 RepID=A0A1H6FII7_THEAL|nr:PfkB family carbohydrate kinase [Thermoleophilum album]SEH10651.1 Sugar or nucleoside kinase, ribokinase family [Thermoleophilum album]
MALTVVGSVAFDSVRTPFGERERMLGGSATHFSLAASFFCEVNLVGVVGEDFDERYERQLTERGIDTQDLQRIAGGKTFFWRGHYDFALNTAHTDTTELNVFADFDPQLGERSRNAEIVFLANIQPQLQRRVRAQCRRARLAALDSMNLWIDSEREELLRAISEVDVVFMNDAELRMLTRQPNLVRAARELMARGPRAVVAKLGEYGASLYTPEGFFSLPAYPLESVVDPTGAGDSFAGGFLGYLAGLGEADIDESVLRRAMTYGSVMASFNVERFGCERVLELTRAEIDERFEEFRRMTAIEALPAGERA